MVFTASLRQLSAAVVLTAVLCGSGGTVRGQGVSESRVHRHIPIDIDAPPIISRLPMVPVRPRRLLLDADGTLILADWGSGTVATIEADGMVHTLAIELNQPAGLAHDEMGQSSRRGATLQDHLR